MIPVLLGAVHRANRHREDPHHLRQAPQEPAAGVHQPLPHLLSPNLGQPNPGPHRQQAGQEVGTSFLSMSHILSTSPNCALGFAETFLEGPGLLCRLFWSRHPSEMPTRPSHGCLPWAGYSGGACYVSAWEARLILREPRLRTAKCDVLGCSEWDKGLLKRSNNSEEAEGSCYPATPGLPEDLVPMGARLTQPLPTGGRVCSDHPWGATSSSLSMT